MQYQNNQQIWDEMRELYPLSYGVTYEKMREMGHVQWPCPDLDSPGTPYLYAHNQFDTANGKGKPFAAPWRAPAEVPDDNYPLALYTVREVGHHSCRPMTGNYVALQTLADEPGYVWINTQDVEKLGIRHRDLMWASSRWGKVISRADVSECINSGTVCMTYQWRIGACNESIQDNPDSISKTPEIKYCAVNIEHISDQRWAERYAAQSYSDMKSRLCEAIT